MVKAKKIYDDEDDRPKHLFLKRVGAAFMAVLILTPILLGAFQNL